MFTHYTPEILLNPVFEDLRMPKVPNNYFIQNKIVHHESISQVWWNELITHISNN
jgi:hypothetical protein